MTKLPNGWEIKRLSDCLEKLKSGKKAERGWSPQCLSHPSRDENVWGVLKTTSVQMGEFQPEYNKELPDSFVPKSGLEVNSGDFLVTTTGPRNRCGIVCHVKKTRKKLIFSGKILRFRVNESLILPNWLMYLLMSPEYQSILDKMKVGTSDSSVSIGNQQILNLEIPVPPIDEQHKIVGHLEDHLSRLDAALADVKQAKLKAAQFRRSLLQAAFTGNLDLDKSSLMTELPHGWSYESINSITEGGMIADGDWVESKDQDPNGQVRLTQLADVGDGEFRSRSDRWMNDEQASRLNVNYLQPGDLLMARMPDPLGRTCMVPENIGRAVTVVDVAIIRITRKEVNPKFVMWLLNSPGIRQQIEMLASGTTRRRITRKNLGTIDLPIPPIDEQNKIVELLEEHLSRLDASVSLADSMEKQSNVLKRSLLEAAFTGQLTKEVVDV